MADRPRILAFAGSLRKGSFNKKLCRLAAKEVEDVGADITVVDLADLNLPLYNADDEEANGLPPGAKKMKQLMIDHDALLIVSPEYNSSITGPLKNAIDWASRPEEGDVASLVAYRGKVAALLSASPGALGGLRGLVHLRSILGNIQVLVIPEQFALSKAHEQFDEQDQLKDAKHLESVKTVVQSLVKTTSALI